ncbi:hypothetical protein [Nannocystis radixulma]|uniref:Tryptophan synthase alpha chain n=1 Tax=Nannocystis radixulma TaxID=2995305 RepID=A0ABT5BFD2_9BACT|nr:hypothetical protein [Nannocystis radixulma]MDC0672423.1 hypothetical protein [Nannocystis radixulma]
MASLAAACNAAQSETTAGESTIGTFGPVTDTSTPPTGGSDGEQCGLECDESAFINGKFTVSGIAQFDAFFAATLELSGAMDATADDLQRQLNGLFALVGANSAADFKTALDAKLIAFVDLGAGWTIEAAPARCVSQFAAAAIAVAACDPDAELGLIDVRCEGRCPIDASAQADCQSDGTLTCRGMAPQLQCEGSCLGSCQLDAAAACDGTCKGICDGQDFIGQCAGMCQGECDLGGGGACPGLCLGVCEFTASPAGCSQDHEAHCEGSATVSASCTGPCDGKLSAPTSAECEATVEATVEAGVQCYPPPTKVDHRLNGQASVDPSLRAELQAFHSTFQERYAALLASTRRAERLMQAAATLAATGQAAVGSLASQLSSSPELKTKIGAECASATLPTAAQLLTSSANILKAQLDAAVPVVASVAG